MGTAPPYEMVLYDLSEFDRPQRKRHRWKAVSGSRRFAIDAFRRVVSSPSPSARGRTKTAVAVCNMA